MTTSSAKQDHAAPPPDTSTSATAANSGARPSSSAAKAERWPASEWRALTPPEAGDTRVVAAGVAGARLFFAGTVGDEDHLKQWIAFVDRAGSVEAAVLAAGDVESASPFGSGGVLLAGEAPREPTRGTVLTAVDKTGKMLWSKIVPSEVGADSITSTAVRGGQIVAIGVQNPIESGVTHGWLLGLDMTGEKKWERKVGEGSYHYLTSLVPMDDGSYVAFGGKKTEARYASWIVSFDAKGEGIREDVEPTERWEGIQRAAAAPGGGAYAIGVSSEKQGAMRSVGAAFVERFDATGKRIWRRDAGEHIAGIGAPVVTASGASFLAGTLNDDEPPTGALMLVSVPADGGPAKLEKIDGLPSMLDFRTVAGALIPGTTETPDVLGIQPRKGGGFEWRVVHAGAPPR